MGRGFQYFFLNLKRENAKVDFDDLVKQKEQLLMLTLDKTTLNESCKTFTAYHQLDSPERDKILQIFKGLQWGEGPFQREVIELINKEFGINYDLLIITNSFKLLIKHDFLITQDKLPEYQELVKLTSLVALYKGLMIKEYQNSFAKKKKIKAKYLKEALVFQINQGEKKKLTSKEFDQGLMALIKKGPDIFKELLLYIKVIDKLAIINPLKSKNDLSGALRIMGLKENSSKKEIKRRYRDLALAQHPDTLSDVDVPPDLLKQANENFNQINLSYKLLLKNIT